MSSSRRDLLYEIWDLASAAKQETGTLGVSRTDIAPRVDTTSVSVVDVRLLMALIIGALLPAGAYGLCLPPCHQPFIQDELDDRFQPSFGMSTPQ